MATDWDIDAAASALIDSDHVGVFDDSLSGYAAALAAAELIRAWDTYAPAYVTANRGTYEPGDVNELIAYLTKWRDRGCPKGGGR